MKFSLSLALFTAFLVASCSEEPQPPPPRHRAASYAPDQSPPPQQRFNPNHPGQPTGTPPVETAAPSPPPTPAATTTGAKGAYPYGMPIPGKPRRGHGPR